MKCYINFIKILNLDNAFINKKRTEDNMLNKIEKTFTKNSVIIIGDWSIGKQMKKLYFYS